ncbi:MAG: hypothetical protein WDO71_01490 [Bacteroidota bacterium]
MIQPAEVMERFIQSGKGFVGIHSALIRNMTGMVHEAGRPDVLYTSVIQTARLKILDAKFPGYRVLLTDDYGRKNGTTLDLKKFRT